MLVRLFFLFILSIPLTAAGQETVAVIGAGPAGIAAAHKLMDNGYQVTILEKDNRIGGKCYTVPGSNGAGIVELGAIQVGPSYDLVMDYAKALNHKLRDYWPARSLRWQEDLAQPIYHSMRTEYLPIGDALSISQETYTFHQALKRFENIDLANLANIPLNSEFNQPFETWADGLGLKHYKEIYRMWITSYGYGKLNEIPAFLPLYLVGSSTGLAFMTGLNINLRMLADGYGSLMEDIVRKYNINVQTGVTISEIIRNPDSVVISYSTPTTSQKSSFDYLVVACGLECINEFLPEKTAEEIALLKDLQFTPYDVVIASVPALPKGGYVLPQNLQSTGHVTLISKNSASNDDVILYLPRGGIRHVGEVMPRPSQEDLAAAVQYDLARFGFNEVKVLQTQYWDTYFPHFSNPYAYDLLTQIQGENRTVYVGSMGRFEIVEKAMSHSIDVIEKTMIKKELKTVPVSSFQRLKKMLSWYFGAQWKSDPQMKYGFQGGI